MKKSRWMDILMESLVFFIMTSSLSTAFLRAIHLPVHIGTIALITIALSVLLRIVFWNKQTAAILLPLSVLVGLAVLRWMAGPEWQRSIQVFLRWQIDCIRGNAILRPASCLPAAWFWICLIGTVLYLLQVKLRWSFLPFALGAALLITLWLLGHREPRWCIWVFALGSILLWGGSFHKKLSGKASLPHYGTWLIHLLPLAVLILLTARILIPADTDYRWPYLVNSVDRVKTQIRDQLGFSGPRQPFRLSETGFPSSPEKLGGPVQLSEDVVLEVSSPMPLYLRGSLLNEYAGSGWTDTIEDMRYRFWDIAWEKSRKGVYNFDEQIWKDLKEKKQKELFPEVEAVVTHIGIKSSAIFHSPQLTDIDTVKGASQPYFNTKGETFTTREIVTGEPYTLRSRVPDRTNPELLQYLTEKVPSIDWNRPLPDSLLKQKGYREKVLSIQKHYMKIPDSVPQRVCDLTKQITAGKDSPYEKIMAIQYYLQSHFAYTVRPPYTPSGRDFVDYFLFDLKEGYCTYFASAMAVMGRAAGIPTRYVEGFLMPSSPNSNGIYEVRKKNAHAWVEAYFPRFGWLTFDPTPADALTESAGENAYRSNDQILYWQDYWEHRMDRKQSKEDNTLDMPSPDSPETEDKTKWSLPAARAGVWIALGFPPALVSAAALILFLWYQRHWKKVAKMPFRPRLHAYYNEILWLLELYGAPVRQGETPYGYAERIDTWLINPAGSMKDIAELMVNTEFGNHRLTEADLSWAEEFYQNLKGSVRDIQGPFRYRFRTIRRMFSYRKQSQKRNLF
ncbi:transglutaminase domain-containing protein [Eubacteriales bacterium mix99]